MATKNKFSKITLLTTHYNRSKSLQRLLQSFKDQQITFGDIVVSDDGSKPEHIDYLKSIQDEYKFRLITTPQNRGLGNNINKGQAAVETPYTLYVQEDFDPLVNCEVHLTDALAMMEEREDIDLVRFYAYFKYPYLKPYKDGFSEMLFSIWYPGYRKFHYYSDHPHLRRSTFLQKFGKYKEGIKSDRTEFLMSISVIKHKGKGLFYEDFKGMFDQINTEDEPSTVKRSDLRQSSSPVIGVIRAIYRNVKHTTDLLFYKVS
jgi:glycosyltransferase involved in cell wall biosynthesis